MRWGLFIFLGIAGLLAAPAAWAGEADDPRPGDILLGKEGGLAYVSDPETVANPEFTAALAACPNTGRRWRLTGGGLVISGAAPASGFTVGASRPLDMSDSFGDDDEELDDYWEGTTDAPVASTLETFAICSKWNGLKHRSRNVRDSPSAERVATDQCGPDYELTGGGGFIATSDSFISSMFPRSERRWRLGVFDQIGGSGGMHNYLVCARGQDLRIRSDRVQIPAGEERAAFVRCKRREHVTGGGARSAGTPGAMNLYGSYPLDLGDGDDAPDDGWQANAYNRSAAPKKLKAYAICAS